jgi:hypothetical protein
MLMHSMFRNILVHVRVLLAATLLTGICWSQGGTGELGGLVTDPSGAVVPNATVTLTNTATGEKHASETTSSGTYRFSALPVVGTYTLEIAAKGFKGYKVDHIVISVGVGATYDAKIEIGSTSEEVTVEAGAQQIQTTESSVSGLLDRRVWQQMPLEARSQNGFVSLLAGAAPAAQSNLTSDRGAAVDGARSGTGNFLVEGFDNNDQGQGGAGSFSTFTGPGGANTTISPDAIQEYRVIEHNFSAEYGKAGGFVTDTVLRGGTNEWHGSLFEYNRIQALAANSWFSNHSQTRDHLVRNQFGGSVGGPIVKDKTFFFFTVEDHKVRSSSPLTGTVMTSSFLNFVNSGAFETFQESSPAGLCVTATGSACPGKFSDSAKLGPLFTSLQNGQKTPLCVPGAPNCLASSLTNIGQGLYTGGLVYPVPVYGQVTVSAPSTFDQMRYTGKVDQNIGVKDKINASYLYDNSDSNFGFAGGDSPANGSNCCGPSEPNHTRAQNAGVTWSHTFSPNVLNQARMAYVRHTGNFPGDPTVAGFPSVQTALDSPTFGYGNASNLPQFFTENEFQYKDDLSITKGKHSLKGGGEYRRTRNGSSFDAVSNGYFIANDVEDLVTDMTFSDQADRVPALAAAFGCPCGSIFEAEASVNPLTAQKPVYYRGYRANEFAVYFQDDWRATPRLTLNLGVRWEYFSPPHNFQPNIDSNFFRGAATTPFTTKSNNPFMPVNSPFYAAVSTGSAQLKNHDIWNKDLNNVGPRVGFAWDVRGNQKLVVRGGYGIGYDRMYNNIFENIRFNPPLFDFALIGAPVNGTPVGALDNPGLYTAPFTSTAVFASGLLTPSLRAVNQNLETAYYEQTNFGFEYQLAKDMVLETNYVGTFGRKLLGVVGANTFDGKNSAGFSHLPINPNYSNISFRANCCNSNYNALQVTLRKRFSGGLQFNGNYTYSKAMDDVSDTFTTKNASTAAYPTDSQNVGFDYGPADFDVRHRAVFSFTYDLPFARRNRWIGGWSASGIVSVQSGANFSVTDSGFDSNKDGQFNDRASWVGSGPITNAINHNVSPATGFVTKSGWAMPGDVSAVSGLTPLACPASVNSGLWCEGSAVSQMQRNSLVGPGYFDTDFGLAKRFRITEGSGLTLQGNFFNIFNHPNFLPPDNNLANIRTTFGQSTATFQPGQGGARVTQLALRFDF